MKLNDIYGKIEKYIPHFLTNLVDKRRGAIFQNIKDIEVHEAETIPSKEEITYYPIEKTPAEIFLMNHSRIINYNTKIVHIDYEEISYEFLRNKEIMNYMISGKLKNIIGTVCRELDELIEPNITLIQQMQELYKCFTINRQGIYIKSQQLKHYASPMTSGIIFNPETVHNLIIQSINNLIRCTIMQQLFPCTDESIHSNTCMINNIIYEIYHPTLGIDLLDGVDMILYNTTDQSLIGIDFTTDASKIKKTIENNINKTSKMNIYNAIHIINYRKSIRHINQYINNYIKSMTYPGTSKPIMSTSKHFVNQLKNDIEILLPTKDLHNIPVSHHQNTYNNAEEDLS